MANYFKNVNGTNIEMSDGEHAARVQEEEAFAADKAANEYKWNRASAYPDWREQLDLLYHDMVADKGNKTGEWFKAVQAVRNANSKPE